MTHDVLSLTWRFLGVFGFLRPLLSKCVTHLSLLKMQGMDSQITTPDTSNTRTGSPVAARDGAPSTL